ncbi:hypothetical protein EXIGLDRAFT_771577, partial [Exidia glandulosa HHB12029]
MPPDLPTDVLRLIFEESARATLCGGPEWPSRLRLVCRAVRDWTHPILFSRIIVTKSTAASFLQLVASISPPFFYGVRSLNLLIDPGAFDTLVMESHIAACFRNVQHLCCSLRVLRIAAILPEAFMAPTHLSIWYDPILPKPTDPVVGFLQNVTHLRVIPHLSMRGSFVETLAALEVVVIDIVHDSDTVITENVDMFCRMRTIRRIEIVTHLSTAREAMIRDL